MYRISARVEAVELQMSECRDAARQLPHRRAISRSGKLDSLFVIVERMTAYNLAVVGGTLPRHQTFPLAAPLRAALFLFVSPAIRRPSSSILHDRSLFQLLLVSRLLRHLPSEQTISFNALAYEQGVLVLNDDSRIKVPTSLPVLYVYRVVQKRKP